jgi:hypothetical protein
MLAEIVLLIAKWVLMYVAMLKRRKHRTFFLCRLRYMRSSLSVVYLENDTPAGRINSNEILLGNDVN